jgi:NADH-quinone oxidoreductase subunit N
MSTIVKTAAFAAFLRLFSTSFSAVGSSWHQIIWIMAALTMLVGNVTAVLQTSTKRMLAYSSVAHAGYMLLGLLAGNNLSNSAILTYATAYSIASIATFCVISIIIYVKETDGIEGFNGLGKSNPFLALIMTIALLSLAGIPPTAGFFAKYYIFTSAFLAGNAGLVMIAILASLIGVYYYFRLIIAMYFKEGSSDKIPLQVNHKFLLVIAALAILAVGLFPNSLIQLLQ